MELTDRDAFKVLEFSASSSYQRHTLFSCDGAEAQAGLALRRAMAAKLDSLRPDVVCISGWALPVSLAALDWAAQNRIPTVMLSESNAFDEPRSMVKEFIKRQVVGLSSSGLAGGTPQADYLCELGIPREHLSVGYDAVDNQYFADNVCEVRSARRQPPGDLPPSPFFLACCRFGQKKNVPRLIEAYARYRELWAESRGPGSSPGAAWPLVIVGDGELRPEIEATIARCGVGQSVHLAGAKSYADIPAYYAMAGAFIHASTTEQWGLVVNEAMASGLPVLVSNRCGCAADLVKDGVNGFAFDPYDVDQLARLMLKITAPNFPVAAFGVASQRIIADWSPECFAAGLKTAVECALKAGPVNPTLLQRALLAVLLRR